MPDTNPSPARRSKACVLLGAWLAALVMPAAAAQQRPPSVPAPNAAPTAGAPSQAAPPSQSRAMTRTSPKISQATIAVSLYGSTTANPSYRPSSAQPPAGSSYASAPFEFPYGVDIGMSILLRTSWCDTDLTAMSVKMTVDGREQKLDPSSVFQPFPNRADAVLRFRMPPTNIRVNEVRSTASYMTQRWELTVDENMAARATWPREWPAATQPFLGKEEGITPDDPAIRSLAEGATPGGHRLVAPFIAARNAVAAVIGRWKALSGGTTEIGPDGTLRGVRFSPDGVYGIGAGKGAPVELAATCVSALRSIGIPSRIVYCLTENGENDSGKALTRFRFICEFFLPEVGWVPFDPCEMRLKGVGNRPVTGPVKGFANVSDLRDCLPMAFRLRPEGFQRADRDATWGWAGNGMFADVQTAASRLMLEESGRGNGRIAKMPAPVGDTGP